MKVFAFQTSFTIQRRTSCFLADNNMLENETPEKRNERMKLVRKIQQSFYQQDELVLSKASKNMLENVPLFRVQWVELPGYQNILNIHVPHYTHMFRRIMSSPKPWRFGHVYLPGGSENLDNPMYSLNDAASKATTCGTLMHISDVVELEDGRFAMVVQGMERFQVVNAIQNVPYSIANIRLLPDVEFESSDSDSSAHANCQKDFVHWNEFEILPTLFNKKITAISPLSNYNSHFFPDELVFGDSTTTTTSTDNLRTKEIEFKVWVALDEMLRLLSSTGLQVSVPSQLLGLLPTDPFLSWPINFQLESYALQFEQKNANVGTFSKSPFVRVSLCESYPSLRRAKRLSYSIWILLDNLLASVGTDGKPSQQELLELTSVNDRLALVYRHLESINISLRNSISK